MTARWIALPLLLAACHSSHATPSPQPQAPSPFASVLTYLRSQVDSAFPGAVIAVGYQGQVVLLEGVGHYGIDDPRPVTPETVYDIASMTKVIGLTTACMFLVDAGKLDLDAPVQAFVPAFQGADKEKVTVRHLLTHSSGMLWWRPLYREAATRAEALLLVDTTALQRQPGDTAVYSDLGIIVLTQAVEQIIGTSLDRFLDTALFRPLAMTSTRYLPPANWRDRIAPTENDTAFRHRMLRGEVHDENTGRLEGVSGHAGLFSTGPDLARFGFWLLGTRAGWRTPGPCPGETGDTLCATPGRGLGVPYPRVASETAVLFTTRQNLPPGSSRALGWDTPSGLSSAGTKLSGQAFGHTGFTGTSIWFDPEKELFIILLTNRVHPTRANTQIYRVRRTVADLVVDALGP